MDSGPTSDPYRRLFETTLDGAVVFDVSTFQIALANKAAADIFGFALPQEMIGQNLLKYIPEEDWGVIAHMITLSLEEKGRNPADIRVVTRDKREVLLSVTATVIEYEGRIATLSTMRDITERKKAQESLREAKEYAENVIKTANVLVVTLDTEGNVTLLNEAGEKITGYKQNEILGKNWFELIVPKERYPNVWEEFTRLKSGGTVVETFENPILTKSGEERIISWKNSVLVLNGQVVGGLSFGTDITERKRAEEALRDSEAKYRRLFESTQMAMEVISAETGLVVLANEATARMFGFASPDDLVGVDSRVYLRPEDRGWVAEGMARALADKAWHEIAELQARTNDGRWLWINGMAVQSEYQGKPALLISLLDITSRKQAEETLRQSEAKFRLLTERTNDLIFTTDLNLKNTYVSPSVERILGLTPEEFSSRDTAQQMTPESLARAQEALLEQLALEQDPKADSRRSVRLELEYYRKDGSTLWLENEVTGIRDANGTLVGVHGVARDISERRKAEQALKESEEKYRLLAERTNDLIWTTDLNLRTTYMSSSVEKVLGFKPEERVGMETAAQITPESLARAQQLLLEQLELEREGKADPNRSLKIELEYYRKDGSTVWLEALVGGIRDEDGALIAIHGVSRDVSERRRAEQALRASEERYRLLAETASDIIWVIDSNLRITYISPSAASLLGYSLQELMAGSFDKVLTPESLATAAQVYMDDLASEESTPGTLRERIIEIEAVCKDGSTLWLEAAVRPIRDVDGRIKGFQGACRDITKRKHAEEALTASEAKYKDLFEHTLVGMEVIDAETGKVVLANHALARIFGFDSPADMVGLDAITGWIMPEDLDWVLQQFAQAMADPTKHDVATLRAKAVDGRIVWVTGSATLVPYGGKPTALVSLVDVTAAKEAELKLHESEERNRLLIDNAAEGIIVIQDGMTKFANRKCAEFTGRSLEELTSTSFVEIVHPADRDMVAENYMRRVASEVVPNNYQFRIIDAQNNTKWLQVNAVRLNWEGKPATMSMLSDVTERVKAEQALRESEGRYRLLAENASDVIWVVDTNLKITYASPAVTRLLGYTIEEVTDGSFLNKSLTPDSLALMAQAYTDDLAGEESRPGSWKERIVEIEVVSKDGSKFWLEAAISNIRDPEGRLAGFQGACRDITERKKAQEALRESEERFRGLVETSSDWVWETDRNTRYTYVSPKVRDILGYEPEELLGRTPYEFMHQREGRRVAKIVRRLAEARLPFSLLENTSTHKDGHSVVLETSAVPIFDSDGILIGYRGIDRDITERKKVEQELQRSLRRLEKTMESTIEAITTTIETRDPYTTGHQVRVTDLACAMAKAMELPPSQIEGIRVAGLLHDIGKIAIPTEILSKPGKLNEVEYEMIKTHAEVGYNILKKIEFPWPVARSVQQHHERWNGSGYPHGIRGEDILIEARILAVADVMEAMSSHRPYRPSIGTDKALEEITRNSGTLYDPAVVNACVTVFTEGGFKSASSMPEAGGTAGKSHDRPVRSLEDH